jgi:sialic acid synthase SpsE
VKKKNIIAARKSIVANKNIEKGEIFSIKNLTTKRPATGFSPMYWDKIVGKKSKKKYKKDELIKIK